MNKIFILLTILFMYCGCAFSATTTTNYGLYKPAQGDVGWATNVNNNFDTIDTTIYSHVVSSTAHSAPFQDTGTSVVLTTSSDNVGIGSASPRARLDVNGAIYGTYFYGNGSLLTGITALSGMGTNYIQKAGTTTTLSDSQIYDNGTNVGIGTITPTARLDIGGGSRSRANVTGLLVKSEIEVDNRIYVDNQLYVGSPTISWVGMNGTAGEAAFANDVEIDGALYVDGFLYGNGSKLTGVSSANSTANAVPKSTGTTLVDSGIYSVGGNIGIGSVNPRDFMDIDGATYIDGAVTINGTLTNPGTDPSNFAGNVGIGSVTPAAKLDVKGAILGGTATPTWAGVTLATSGDALFAGDVEIDNALYVDGFIYGNGSKLTGLTSGVSANTTANSIPRSTGSVFLDSAIYNVGSNVGIGSTTPKGILDVVGTDKMIYIDGTIYEGGFTVFPQAQHGIRAIANSATLPILAVYNNAQANVFGIFSNAGGDGEMRFRDDTATTRIQANSAGDTYITSQSSTGCFGVASTAPGAKLDLGGFSRTSIASAKTASDMGVAGSAEVDGNIYLDTGLYLTNSGGYLYLKQPDSGCSKCGVDNTGAVFSCVNITCGPGM